MSLIFFSWQQHKSVSNIVQTHKFFIVLYKWLVALFIVPGLLFMLIKKKNSTKTYVITHYTDHILPHGTIPIVNPKTKMHFVPSCVDIIIGQWWAN